jgi:hypothetical protein
MTDVQSALHRSIVERALLHAEPQFGWNKRIRPSNENIVKLRAGLPSNNQDVLEAFRREKRNSRALAFKQRVVATVDP